jgi:hypothetical protein
VGEGGSTHAGNRLGLVTGLLVAAAVSGAVGGTGVRLLQEWGFAGHPAARNPVIILSVADLLRGGKDALAVRALAGRLADGGFLVLDAQAVLAAPPELYLQAAEETAP